MKDQIIDETKKIASITISGELNGMNLPNLSEKMNALLEQGILHLILDFSDMHFISSLGIGCIASVGAEFNKKQGSINLVCHTPRLLAEFELMRLNEVVNIYMDFNQAIASIR